MGRANFSTGLMETVGPRWARPSSIQQEYSRKANFPAAGTLPLARDVRIRMALIPPGEFMMGSDMGYDNQERPVHRVVIPKPFYMGIHQVTQAQYQAVMGHNPSHFRGDERPIESVSWEMAVDFCQRASKLVGSQVSLPTEAEWEYACRAGMNTEYCCGDSEYDLIDYAWFGNEDCHCKTHAVGQKKPNDWGLFDMHGNVWEWCMDWHDKTYYARSPVVDPKGPTMGTARICRGGAWNYQAINCRSAYRYWHDPEAGASHIGFRVRFTPKTV